MQCGFRSVALRSSVDDQRASVGFRGLMGREGLAWVAGSFASSENAMADLMLAVLRGVWLDGIFDQGPGSDVMVCGVERFVLQMFSMDPDLLAPERINAKFAYAAERTGLTVPVFWQSAADSMETVPDGRLREWNLWRPGEDHPRDALRQAVLLARRFVDVRWRTEMLRRCRWLFK